MGSLISLNIVFLLGFENQNERLQGFKTKRSKERLRSYTAEHFMLLQFERVEDGEIFPRVSKTLHNILYQYL